MTYSHRIPGNDAELDLETEQEQGREVAGWTTTENKPQTQFSENPFAIVTEHFPATGN